MTARCRPTNVVGRRFDCCRSQPTGSPSRSTAFAGWSSSRSTERPARRTCGRGASPGSLSWELLPRFVDHDAEAGGGGPVCPLPGTVIAVHVDVGDQVEAGAVLMVVEAMKMEHKITAAHASTVTDVHFDVGGRVDQGDLLVSLEAAADDVTPIRIANCSGFFGDRPSGAVEMVEGGPIDVLTGDWLAELTMLILSRIQAKRPGQGYARTFVGQMEQVMGTCLDRGIKVVSNAGGLDPDGCAEAVHEVAGRLGLSPTIAYIDGDDLLPTDQRAGRSWIAPAVQRGRRTRRRVSFRQRQCVSRLLRHRRRARRRRRHRDHGSGHRRRGRVRSGRVASRVGSRRFRPARRRRRRRPRHRVQRAGDGRELLVLHGDRGT